MRTTKKTRCYSCKKSIGARKPNLVLNNLAYRMTIQCVETKRGAGM